MPSEEEDLDSSSQLPEASVVNKQLEDLVLLQQADLELQQLVDLVDKLQQVLAGKLQVVLDNQQWEDLVELQAASANK